MAAVGALVLGVSSACRRAEPPKLQKAQIWQTVGSWSGRGSVQTESFPSDGAIRIRWSTTNVTPPGPGMFRVTIHSAISGRPLATAVDHQGVGGDVAYIGEDPRVFYAEVESSDLEWAITIEDATAAVVDRDVRPSVPSPGPVR